MTFSVRGPGFAIQGRVPFVGKHFLYNLVAAAAVALESNMDPEVVQEGLTLLRPLPQRGQILYYNRATIWDDTYNSNPEAVASLLDTLSQVHGYERRILVLGDMLELGRDSSMHHSMVGKRAANSNLDFIVTVGTEARKAAEAANRAGFPNSQIRVFADSSEAAAFIEDFIEPSDLVLIKGSRGMKMELITERLRGVHA
jgi:UDP-N-acetylmuramoyl-tripeptide--D-alanyl-D-alanine ligase